MPVDPATLASWSAPRTIPCSFGDRILRTAEPTPAFYAALASDPNGLCKAGVQLNEWPKGSGRKQLAWWAKPPKPPPPLKTAAHSESITLDVRQDFLDAIAVIANLGGRLVRWDAKPGANGQRCLDVWWNQGRPATLPLATVETKEANDENGS